MMYWGNGMWGMAFMVLGSLLFWGLIVTGIVMLVRYLGGPSQHTPAAGAGPSAQQLLAERYARGEIDEDEYTRRLQVLGPTPSRGSGG